MRPPWNDPAARSYQWSEAHDSILSVRAMTPRRRSAGPGPAILLVLALGLVLVAGGWWWFSSREEPIPAPQPSGVPAAAAPPSLDEEQPVELPPLNASDELIRELAAGLSEHPRLAFWLVTDELVRRFVAAIVDLAGGLSPSSRVEFMVPEEEFPIVESGGGIRMDPAGYRRYDVLTEAFTSLDTDGTAELYRTLYPLFEEAYAELGIPDGTFADAMSLAVENVVSTEIPSGPFELQPNEAIYEFQDLSLESRSPAEKHLIRMGPENARRVQTKMTEVWGAILAEGEPGRP